MALSKIISNIPFTQGLDQKTDPKQTEKLAAVDNGRFTKFGEVNKRYGFDALSTDVISGDDFTEAANLISYKDELVLFSDSSLYSYADGNEKWIEKGDAICLSTVQKSIVSNNYMQANADVANVGGFTIYAWEDTRGGIRTTVLDEATNTNLLTDTVVSASGTCPRVIGISGYLYVFFVEANLLRWKRISTEAPTTLSAATTIATDINTTPIYKIINYGTSMLLTYKDTSSDIRLAYITRNGAIGTPLLGFPPIKTINETPTYVLSLTYLDADDQYIALAWQEAGVGVKTAVYNRNFIEHTAPMIIDPVVLELSNISGFQGAFDSNALKVDPTTIRWYYTVKDADTTKTYIKSTAVTLAGAISTNDVFVRSVGLIADVFMHDNIIYVPTLHESVYQSTVFLMNSKGFVAAKFFDVATSFSAGSLPTKPFLSKTFIPSTDKVSFSAPVREKLITANNTAYTLQGIRKCEVDFSGDTAYNTALVGNSLYLSGGIVYSYDGLSVVESGFHIFPEGVTSLATPASGADGLPNGTYQYAVLYSWVDNKGELQRSATSIPITYVNASGADNRVTLTIPTLRITQKTAPRTDVQIEVYRTEDAGEIFYRVFDYSGDYIYNNPLVDTVTFADETIDDDLISNEILYTTGGVLDNDAPPSASIVLAHQNRVFLLDTQTTDKFYYSKRYVPGQAVNFSAYLTGQVNPSGGKITAAGSLDDKLVIFKRDNIYAVFGDGPTPSGENNTFSEPQLVASDVGCTNINSVAYTPMGLVFMSAKGIYLLDKGLNTEYIGAAVENYNNADITSAQLVDDVNEVRFTTSTGTTLVYNYFFKQWSTFSDQEGIASCTWKNKYLYVDAEGNVFKENTSVFYDEDVSYSLKIETGWLKQFTGIQGFQRVYRAALIGTYKSEHRLKVKIYYDYENFPSQTVYFNPDGVIGGDTDETYGEISPYGEAGSTYGGGLSNVYQFRMHLKRQQCTALKFVIEDIPDNDSAISSGESLGLSALSLEIGVKQGLSRLRSSKSL